MENKVNLPALAAMLALATGKQKKLCEDFLKELFRIVALELEEGENVRIKGFGTFKLVDVEARKSVNVATGEEHEIPGHKKVIFVAAKELASKVNAPFEAFEAVEIADSIPTDLLEGDAEAGDDCLSPEAGDSVMEQVNADGFGDYSDSADASCYAEIAADSADEPISSVDEQADSVDEQADSVDEQSDSVDEDADSVDEQADSVDEQADSVDEDADSVDEDDDTDDGEELPLYEPDDEPKRHRFAWGFLCGFAVAAVAVCIVFGAGYYFGYFVGEKMSENKEATEMVMTAPQKTEGEDSGKKTASAETAKADNAEADNDGDVPTQPSDEPVATADKTVYDTVTTTRYLTTIAKEHYGNFNLWPIIYEENKDILGHPDRIRPGTKVVVPPLKKYGIDPSDPAQIKEVKKKGIEIYSRYK